MTAVPAVLLAAALAVGVPGFGEVVARAVAAARPGTPAVPVHWSGAGILLGLVSTTLAAGLAAAAVQRPRALSAPGWALPLRKLQSGHVGDYVAWLVAGAALLAALTLPGLLSG
ncbi:hypothetical protein RKD23_000914 [Streptomyces sp. SAI-170]